MDARDEALKALIAEFEALTDNTERATRAMELVDNAMDWGYSHGMAAGLDAAMRMVSGEDETTVAHIRLEPDDPLAEHLRSVAEAEAGAGDDDE